ncbi:MAG: tetratricopeptide repeat protein [Archangium sp.]|nr:tetratricopeptide repeat protein [Archangium sp.]
MADDAAALAQRLQKWADGKSTLKEVRGYTDEELYSIARTGYYFFYQGKVNEARTVFQGLYAINPMDAYFAKALGVVEMAAGNPAGAVAAYDVAIKIAPQDAAAYLGRAEVKLLQGQKNQALDDLRRAQQYAQAESPENQKVLAMLQALSRK